MFAEGYIQVHAYTSSAQIPLPDVAVKITDLNGDVFAMRLTNQSGQLPSPVTIPVPDSSAGQTPDTGIQPFAQVNLYARAENYEQIEVENLQVFPDIITDLNLEMIPLSELPGQWNKAEIIQVPTQNL